MALSQQQATQKNKQKDDTIYCFWRVFLGLWLQWIVILYLDYLPNPI